MKLHLFFFILTWVVHLESRNPGVQDCWSSLHSDDWLSCEHLRMSRDHNFCLGGMGGSPPVPLPYVLINEKKVEFRMCFWKFFSVLLSILVLYYVMFTFLVICNINCASNFNDKLHVSDVSRVQALHVLRRTVK